VSGAQLVRSPSREVGNQRLEDAFQREPFDQIPGTERVILQRATPFAQGLTLAIGDRSLRRRSTNSLACASQQARRVAEFNRSAAVKPCSFGAILFGHLPQLGGGRLGGRAAGIVCTHDRQFRRLSVSVHSLLPHREPKTFNANDEKSFQASKDNSHVK
jgi:hypothetical protein